MWFVDESWREVVGPPGPANLFFFLRACSTREGRLKILLEKAIPALNPFPKMERLYVCQPGPIKNYTLSFNEKHKRFFLMYVHYAVQKIIHALMNARMDSYGLFYFKIRNRFKPGHAGQIRIQSGARARRRIARRRPAGDGAGEQQR